MYPIAYSAHHHFSFHHNHTRSHLPRCLQLALMQVDELEEQVVCSGQGDNDHPPTGMLYIKRKQETVVCSDLVTDEMADCIVQLHCMTGCDANSGFYGKVKKSVFDQVAKSPVARQQLSQCGDSLDLEEEVLQELFKFTRHVIVGYFHMNKG